MFWWVWSRWYGNADRRCLLSIIPGFVIWYANFFSIVVVSGLAMHALWPMVSLSLGWSIPSFYYIKVRPHLFSPFSLFWSFFFGPFFSLILFICRCCIVGGCWFYCCRQSMACPKLRPSTSARVLWALSLFPGM